MHQQYNDQQLTIQLISIIEQYYQQAELFFNQLFERPQIKINLTGCSAGTATPQSNLLRFNKHLLINNQQHFLEQTVPHEVAHLVAYHLFGLNIRPHGKEWRYIMQHVYNRPAERCHYYNVQKKSTTYYIYRCACHTQHKLTIRRHNAIKKGARYICKQCKENLFFSQLIEHK